MVLIIIVHLWCDVDTFITR